MLLQAAVDRMTAELCGLEASLDTLWCALLLPPGCCVPLLHVLGAAWVVFGVRGGRRCSAPVINKSCGAPAKQSACRFAEEFQKLALALGGRASLLPLPLQCRGGDSIDRR